MIKDGLLKDDSGVTIILEFIFSLVVMVILFTIMMLVLGNIIENGNHVALKEEYDIIANDVANRVSAFSSEVYLNDQKGTYESTTIGSQVLYFDLPEPVNGKQYQVDVSYDAGKQTGTVRVSAVADSTIYSTATFRSVKTVAQSSFNSQPERYEMSYDPVTKTVSVGYIS